MELVPLTPEHAPPDRSPSTALVPLATTGLRRAGGEPSPLCLALSSSTLIGLRVYLDEFARQLTQQKPESSTAKTYWKRGRFFIAWLEQGRDPQLRRLDRACLEAYREWLDRRFPNLRTKNGYLTAVRQFLAWLVPVVRSTESVSPDAEERVRAFGQYAGQLNGSVDHFSLAPQVFGRSGAVAVAALLLIPLTALASRRRWAAYVVGGSLAIFAVTLVPWLFTPFADIVSLSQARRLAGFLPFAFALAGGMGVLAALIGRLAIPLALVSGIVLQWLYPGDFGYTVEQGGPVWATYVAVAGALVAFVVGIVRPRSVGTTAALASALILLPTFVAGLADWSASPARTASPLTPGLVQFLRNRLPPGDVVYADLESSYRIGAAAPVFICNAPPGHVADTKRNRPYVRRAQWRQFNRTGELGIPKRCGAAWLVIDRDRFTTDPGLKVVYRDGRYVVYEVPA